MLFDLSAVCQIDSLDLTLLCWLPCLLYVLTSVAVWLSCCLSSWFDTLQCTHIDITLLAQAVTYLILPSLVIAKLLLSDYSALPKPSTIFLQQSMVYSRWALTQLLPCILHIWRVSTFCFKRDISNSSKSTWFIHHTEFICLRFVIPNHPSTILVSNRD
jgi:hypothetical protein